MRIQHGMNVDIPLRAYERARVAQGQDGVERIAKHALPAAHLAACCYDDIATVGIILPAQQVAPGFHPHIAAAGCHQFGRIRRSGGHACLGWGAGGDVFHVAAGLQRNIAPAQRADALLELVEAHPPGRLAGVLPGG